MRYVKSGWNGSAGKAALTMNCPDCRGVVSTRALTCPHCGAPLSATGVRGKLSPIECYFEGFRKYAQFSGRATRSEYWFFCLFSWLVGLAAQAADAVIGTAFVFYFTYCLTILIPSSALVVRRLHDTNRSAWWCALWLVPVIGWIWLVVLFCMRGTDGPNRYD